MGVGSGKSSEKYGVWPKSFHLRPSFYSPGHAPNSKFILNHRMEIAVNTTYVISWNPNISCFS